MRKFIGLSICAVLAFGCGDDDMVPDATVGDGGVLDVLRFDLGGGDDRVVFDGGPDFDGGTDFDGGDGGGTDAPDMGSSCETYDEPCTAERGCLEPGFVCREEFVTSSGGAADPIADAPAGEEMYTGTFWTDGMCTPSTLTTGAAACKMEGDPGFDDDTTCGDCGSCTDIFGAANGNMCVRNCMANSMDNDTCRDTYVCSLTTDQCLPIGCTTDTECRVTRPDSNGIPGIQFPRDCTDNPAACGGMADNFDNLVYDTDSAAVCNQDTYLCTGGPSNAAASGGDTCTEDSQCEAGGRCIQESRSCTNNADFDCTTDAHCAEAITGSAGGTCGDPTWLGGSCIKLGCEVAGNECANDGICQERGLGVQLCLDGCTMGMGATPADMSTWIDPATGGSGCRTGYNCAWNGVGGHGVANNGVCLPAGFNDVTEENIGAQCSDESECWSPLGRARCIRWATTDEFGYCTVNDCLSPDFPVADPVVSVCGAESCVNFGGAENPFGLCVENCTMPSECSSAGNMGCVSITGGEDKVCFPGCSMTEECQAGFTCNGATAMALGDCVPM